MKKLLLPLAIALPFAQVGLADYQVELNYNYTDEETDLGGGIDSEINNDDISGTVFFEAVDTSKGPYAEAEFLSKASSLFAGYMNTEVGLTGAPSVDENTVYYGAHVVLEDKWIVGASAADNDAADAVSVELGMYLDDMSTLTLGYTESDSDTANDDSEIITLGYKRVTGHDDGSFCNIEAVLSHTDHDSNGDFVSLDLAYDYYIDKHFSVGLILGYEDSNDVIDDSLTYGVRAGFYFTDKLGIDFTYTEVDNDDFNENIQVWNAGITLRF